MTDLAAILAAVYATPDDDTPRLVLADCLEENGEHDRAEFIRAGVDLAREPDTVEKVIDRVTFDQPILGKYGVNTTGWTVTVPVPNPKKAALQADLDAILSRHPEWSRCPCPPPPLGCGGTGFGTPPYCHTCSATGNLLLQNPGIVAGVPLDYAGNPRPIRWERGFAIVSARLEEIGEERDGRFHPTPWALALVEAWSWLDRFRVMDREADNRSSTEWFWWSDIDFDSRPEENLPESVFTFIEATTPKAASGPPSPRFLSFRTPGLAHLALGRGVTRLVREYKEPANT